MRYRSTNWPVITYRDFQINRINFQVFFAFVPPTEYVGGWACFVVSILMIGLLTAVIGDVASQFGCIVNLNDAVTAITLVAMGTSVPGKIGYFKFYTKSLWVLFTNVD